MVKTVGSLVVLSLSLAGCRGCDQKPKEEIAVLSDAAPPPAFNRADRSPPAEILNDSLWRLAMDEGDVLDLASLADGQGASGLLEALEYGGKVGQTALRALPHAPDAPVALRRLAELLLLTTDSMQREVLLTIQQILGQPNPFGEPVDEGGRKAAAAALLHVAKDEEAPASSRSLAVSTLRSPAFRGIVSPGQIPTIFDRPAPGGSRVPAMDSQ